MSCLGVCSSKNTAWDFLQDCSWAAVIFTIYVVLFLGVNCVRDKKSIEKGKGEAKKILANQNARKKSWKPRLKKKIFVEGGINLCACVQVITKPWECVMWSLLSDGLLGDFNFKVKCLGIIIQQFKCCNDSKFPPECSNIAFWRLWKFIFFPGWHPRNPVAFYVWTSETFEYSLLPLTNKAH